MSPTTTVKSSIFPSRHTESSIVSPGAAARIVSTRMSLLRKRHAVAADDHIALLQPCRLAGLSHEALNLLALRSLLFRRILAESSTYRIPMPGRFTDPDWMMDSAVSTAASIGIAKPSPSELMAYPFSS